MGLGHLPFGAAKAGPGPRQARHLCQRGGEGAANHSPAHPQQRCAVCQMVAWPVTEQWLSCQDLLAGAGDLGRVSGDHIWVCLTKAGELSDTESPSVTT